MREGSSMHKENGKGVVEKIIGQNGKKRNKKQLNSPSLFFSPTCVKNPLQLSFSISSASPCKASSGRSKRRCGKRPGRRSGRRSILRGRTVFFFFFFSRLIEREGRSRNVSIFFNSSPRALPCSLFLLAFSLPPARRGARERRSNKGEKRGENNRNKKPKKKIRAP